MVLDLRGCGHRCRLWGNAPDDHDWALLDGQALTREVGVSVPDLDAIGGCAALPVCSPMWLDRPRTTQLWPQSGEQT
jgi:hypothetical protein